MGAPSKNVPRSLANPPIREAVIELRVAEGDSSARLSILEKLSERLRNQFPKIEPMHQLQAVIRLSGPKGPEAQNQESGQIGFRMFDEANERIVQLRTDRIVYSLTYGDEKAYSGWETLRDPARKLWEIYSEALERPPIVRLGVRYINSMLTPKISEAVSSIASDGSPGVRTVHTVALNQFGKPESMVARTVLSFAEEQAKAHVQQAWSPTQSPPDHAEMILDVDAYREFERDNPPADPWEVVEGLRKIKNDLFFNSFSAEILEAFDK